MVPNCHPDCDLDRRCDWTGLEGVLMSAALSGEDGIDSAARRSPFLAVGRQYPQVGARQCRYAELAMRGSTLRFRHSGL